MARRGNLANPASRAFTLIELLVVISIMSMLMSILLPVTSRAKEQGYRIQCMSRMRQLTLAWNFYAIYNDDKLCNPDTHWNDPGHNWVADGPTTPGNSIGGTEQAIKNGVLWPYAMKTLELYECSSARSGRSVNSRPDRLRDYSISNTMGGYNRDGVRTFRTLSEISRPAEKMIFTDTDGGFCGAISGVEQFHWMSDSFWPLDMSSGNPRWHFERGSGGVAYNIITLRHNDGCNLSFADFHCEYWRWRDRKTIKMANDEISEQQASDNNADLARMVRLLKGH